MVQIPLVVSRPLSLSVISLGTSFVQQYPHNADVSFCCSANTGVSMCRSPQENLTYEFILPPAVPSMSSLSYFDGL